MFFFSKTLSYDVLFEISQNLISSFHKSDERPTRCLQQDQSSCYYSLFFLRIWCRGYFVDCLIDFKRLYFLFSFLKHISGRSYRPFNVVKNEFRRLHISKPNKDKTLKCLGKVDIVLI